MTGDKIILEDLTLNWLSCSCCQKSYALWVRGNSSSGDFTICPYCNYQKRRNNERIEN